MHDVQDQLKTVSVVGLGYIGLPTAATLATRGVSVIGVDTNPAVVSKINEGLAHFSEPDLDVLLEAAVATGKLKAVVEPQEADAFLIAVPTPFQSDKKADLTYVEQAARAIARVLRPGNLVILESTCPIGTTYRLCDWISEERPDLDVPSSGRPGDIKVAYCPERILPGRMVFELVENDRIIGGISRECGSRAESLYKMFVRGALVQTTAEIGELVKLTENAFRDVNIAFANELSLLCDRLDLNVWDAIRLANRHPRVNILTPGPGVGGHCIAVDPWFLIEASPNGTPLMRAARQVNDAKPIKVIETIRGHAARFKRAKIACLGLSYKPNVDDLRESPALQIAEALAHDELDVLVVEPHLAALPEKLQSHANVSFTDVGAAFRDADIVALLVAHDEFRNVNYDALLSRVVIDTTGLWNH